VRTQFGDVELFPKPVPFLDLLAALGRIHPPSSAV
jgi:hypothetical protein